MLDVDLLNILDNHDYKYNYIFNANLMTLQY